jgi:hypothetical protein
MATYDLGTLTIADHDVDQLTDALDIPTHRFDALVDLAHRAWEYEDTISESIEFIAKNASGSELVLTLVFFGRIWEDNEKERDESEEEQG